MSINLLPEELRLVTKRPIKTLILIAGWLFYCFFFFSTNGFLYLKIVNLEKQYREWEVIQRELDAIQNHLEQLDQEISLVEEEKGVLERLLHQDKGKTEMLLAIQNHLPQNLRLHRLLISEEGWVELKGEVFSMEQVGQLVNSLDNIETFQDVRLTSLEWDELLDIRVFRIELLLNN